MFAGTTPDPADLLRSAGFKTLGVLFAMGILAVYVWIFAIWRSYRELNQVSRVRSAIAFVVYLMLSPIALGLQFLMGASLFSPTQTPFPAELVGKWETPPEKGPSVPLFPNRVIYRFDPQGYYQSLESKNVSNGGCRATIVDSGWGHASVKGSTPTLHPYKRTESIDDTCVGKKSESAKELTNEVYQYAIHQYFEGQELCLSGRFGETCMVPEKP